MTWNHPAVLGEQVYTNTTFILDNITIMKGHGGFFCHFNNLRYTRHVMARNKSIIIADGFYLLHNFTRTLLRQTVGVLV